MSLHGESPTQETAEMPGEDAREASVEDDGYPHGLALAIIATALGVSLFVAGLDETIVATASPTITNQFGALDDAGWYGSAYLLTMASLQLPFGKLYTMLPVKWLFLAAVGILEVGSIVCACAQSSVAFIVGRAVAGTGAAGIISGCLIIVSLSIPLQFRPRYGGILAGVEAVAIILAPLIGGALTTHASWRWCFWINLPLGGLAMFGIAIFFKPPSKEKANGETQLTWKDRTKQFDFLGAIVLIGSTVSLLLALQWGGTRYSWRNGRVIALLVISAVLMGAFVGIQSWKKDSATLPGRVFKQRTVFFCVIYGFCLTGTSGVLAYYLPLWFQAVKDASALMSGVMLLPIILATLITGICIGFVVSAVGYYTPFMILGGVFVSVGSGLLTTLSPKANAGRWIGYQILAGIGRGLGSQQGMVAVQVVLKPGDIPFGVASIMFANTLGSAVFISVAQNVFLNLLRHGLDSSIPDVDPSLVLDSGATSIKQKVGAADLPRVRELYSFSVTRVFFVPVALACTCIIAAIFVEWKSVKPAKKDDEVDNEDDSPTEHQAVSDEKTSL